MTHPVRNQLGVLDAPLLRDRPTVTSTLHKQTLLSIYPSYPTGMQPVEQRRDAGDREIPRRWVIIIGVDITY